MSFKPSGWMWVLGLAASLLVLLVVLLLRHGAESAAPNGANGAGGMQPGLRKPFPEGGEFDGVQRPNTLQPRKQLPPDSQFQRPERQ